MTHICVSKLSTIGSDNQLLLVRRQGNTWTHDVLSYCWQIRNNCNEMLIKIKQSSNRNMSFRMSLVKWLQCCVSADVFRPWCNLSLIQRLHFIGVHRVQRVSFRETNLINIGLMESIGNHINRNVCDVITHSRPNINGGLVKLPLKLDTDA